MKLSARSSSYKRQLFICIFLFFIFLFALFIFTGKLNFKWENKSLIIFINSVDPKLTSLNSQIPNIQKKHERINYDFKAIMEEKSLKFDDKKIGFKISYPPAMTVDNPTLDQIESRYGNPTKEEIVGGVHFSLISQPPGAYEMYDGLTVDIIYFQNLSRKTLDQFINQFINYEATYGTGTKFEKYLTVNGVKIAKLDECCYAGGTKKYIAMTKNNKYFIEIIVFSPGPDRENFEQVANKIVNSLQILD